MCQKEEIMRFKKFNPNEYVMVVKKGQVVKEGLGLSVLFNELSTSIMVVLHKSEALNRYAFLGHNGRSAPYI